MVRNLRIRKGTRKITTKTQFQTQADTQAQVETQVNAIAAVNAEAMEQTWDWDSHNSFRTLILANQLAGIKENYGE